MYTLRDIRAHLPLYREARRAAGKPGPGIVELKRYVHVAPTRQRALDDARAYMESYWANDFYRAGGFQESGTVRLDIPWEEAVRERAVVGTPDEVVRALQAMVDEIGASHLALFWKRPGWTHAEYLDAIGLLGREVVPHLRPAAPHSGGTS